MKGHFNLFSIVESDRISEEVDILQVLGKLGWCLAIKFWGIGCAIKRHLELLGHCWWQNLYLISWRWN